MYSFEGRRHCVGNLQMIFRLCHMPTVGLLTLRFICVSVYVLTWRLIYINQIVLNINTNLCIFQTAHSHLLKFPHFDHCFSLLFVHGFGSCSYKSSTALILYYFKQLFLRHTFALHTACAMGKWSITFQSFNSRTKNRTQKNSETYGITTIGMCQAFILLHTIVGCQPRKTPWECFPTVPSCNRKYANEAGISAYILIFKKTRTVFVLFEQNRPGMLKSVLECVERCVFESMNN